MTRNLFDLVSIVEDGHLSMLKREILHMSIR
jgi:hypothetical protein